MGTDGTDYWKKKNDSLTDAVISLQEKLAEVVRINTILVMEKKQWEIDKLQQGAIIAQAVNSANLLSQSQGQEIQALKEEIKRLKGE